jgi:hypothetical protein
MKRITDSKLTAEQAISRLHTIEEACGREEILLVGKEGAMVTRIARIFHLGVDLTETSFRNGVKSSFFATSHPNVVVCIEHGKGKNSTCSQDPIYIAFELFVANLLEIGLGEQLSHYTMVSKLLHLKYIFLPKPDGIEIFREIALGDQIEYPDFMSIPDELCSDIMEKFLDLSGCIEEGKVPSTFDFRSAV